MKKLFDEIRVLSASDKYNHGIAEAMCKLSEEFGELAQVVCMKIGRKKHKYNAQEIKFKAIEESADLIQNVFCVADKFGITYEELADALSTKNNKWKNYILIQNSKNEKII